ncbi:MAG: DegV family protein [Clostridia bacterium]|nr:DegV family protein [Clostridia bacterium]
MKWKIISDSSCDLMKKDVACEEVDFTTIPFILNIGNEEYIDTEDLDTDKMISAMENCSTACGSACPSPANWLNEYKNTENAIAITISSNLSGSHNSAVVAKEMATDENKNVAVLDSRSTGPELAICIEELVKFIKSELPFDEVVKKANEVLAQTKTAFALCSFDNLVKNGRMSRLTGFVARKLGMWGIGIASEQGTISVTGKSRGPEKAISLIINDMIERGFSGARAIISHCKNEHFAAKLKNAILEKWENASVSFLETRGLDSFYAERGGIIIAYR